MQISVFFLFCFFTHRGSEKNKVTYRLLSHPQYVGVIFSPQFEYILSMTVHYWNIKLFLEKPILGLATLNWTRSVAWFGTDDVSYLLLLSKLQVGFKLFFYFSLKASIIFFHRHPISYSVACKCNQACNKFVILCTYWMGGWKNPPLNGGWIKRMAVSKRETKVWCRSKKVADWNWNWNLPTCPVLQPVNNFRFLIDYTPL